MKFPSFFGPFRSKKESVPPVPADIIVPAEVRSLQENLSRNCSEAVRSLMTSVEHSDVEGLRKIDALIRAIRQLSYHEYLIVDGFFKHLQMAQAGNAMKFPNEKGVALPNVAAVLAAFGPLGRHHDSAKEAVLLLRLVCPFGKNLANPRFDEKAGRLHFDTDKPCTIQWSKETITLAPTDDPGVMTVSANGHTCLLREGTPLILGQKLVRRQLFGVRLPASEEKEPIEVASALPLSDLGVSRAGMMIAIYGGKLYIFDKASKNMIFVHQDDRKVTYNPNAVGADGIHGETGIQRILPREDLSGDSHAS